MTAMPIATVPIAPAYLPRMNSQRRTGLAMIG